MSHTYLINAGSWNRREINRYILGSLIQAAVVADERAAVVMYHASVPKRSRQ